MKYSVWVNDNNECVVGSYSYSYYTDSFKVSYIKVDKNIDKLAWFTLTTYNNINFGKYKNIGDWFETLNQCYQYIVEYKWVNLSLPVLE